MNPSVSEQTKANLASGVEVVSQHASKAHYSPETLWSTLVDVLQWRGSNQPHKTAYIYLTDGESEEQTLTYSDVDQQAKAVATSLLENGLEGKNVLLMYHSGLEFISAFFGCLYAGVTAIPVYPPKKNSHSLRLDSIISSSFAKAILTTDKIKTTKKESSIALESLPWISTDTIKISNSKSYKKPKINPNDTAFLQYTSGSTSEPKGVMITHKNIMENERMIKNAFEHNASSIVVGWLPIFHDMGLIGNLLQPAYAGIPYIQMAPKAFLEKPVRWLQAISKYKATTSGGPNFAFEHCLHKIKDDKLKGLDLSHWKVAFNGAEPIQAQTLKRFSKKFSQCGFKESSFFPCYGMAETTLFVTGHTDPKYDTINATSLEAGLISRNSGNKETTLVSSGKNVEGQKLRIVNPKTKTQCQDNEVGEIWVSGKHIAEGYWQLESKTKEAFNATIAETNEGPFLRTGDLGYLREDGELFVTGRAKDVIIINGKNHYPQDIELTTEQTDSKIQPFSTAAFSIEENGEEHIVIATEIQRQYMRNTNLEELALTILKTVSSHHEVPIHSVNIVRPMSIPKTSSGKIQRHAAKMHFLNKELKSLFELDTQTTSQEENKIIVQPETESEEILVNILKEVLETEDVSTTDDFFSLGGNSLIATQILSRIDDQFEVEISFQDLFDVTNIKELAVRIETAQIEALEDIDPELLKEMMEEIEA